MLPFNVCIIRFPKPGPGFEAYREVAQTLTYGLRRLGHQAELTDNHIVSNQINIIFGFQVLSREMAFPPATIFYNLEPIILGPRRLKPIFYEIKDRITVWDYSSRNCDSLRQFG